MKTKKTIIKIMKITGFSLIVVTLLLTSCKVYYNNFYANKPAAIITNVYSKTIVWTPIRWSTDQYSDRAALYIPIKIDTISNKFYAQFDLGTQRTGITSLNKGFP